MKHCSRCRRIYADDSLFFCLDDGTPLSPAREPQATLPYPPPELRQTLPYSPNTFPSPQESPSERPTEKTSSRGINPLLITTVIASLLLVMVSGIALWLFVKATSRNVIVQQGTPTPRTASSPAPSPKKYNSLASQIIGKWKWGSEIKEYRPDGTGTAWDNGKKCHDFTYYLEDDILRRTTTTPSQCSTGSGVYRISISGDTLRQVFIENGYISEWKRN
jgi:hypothetical protein